MNAEAKAEIAKLTIVRHATIDDVPFIRDSWKNAAYKHTESQLWHSGFAKKPSWQVWTKLFPGVIDRILAHAEAHILCTAERPDQILAYSVTERLENGVPVVHWVSTKKDFWRHGFAARLLLERGFDAEQPAVYTCASSAYTVLKERVAKWDYVPFWLFALGNKG